MELLNAIFVTLVVAAMPMIFAGLGELMVEKSGVLNLGVEGMMILGALAGFVSVLALDSAFLAIFMAACAGAALSALFGVLVLLFRANQVATGLALTLFGLGLSALMGSSYVGMTYEGLPKGVPLLESLPILGPLLFGFDVLVYVGLGLVVLCHWFLSRTRAGLELRAVGENHAAAHTIGYPVLRIRFLAILFGGAMAGLGGGYLSLAYTPFWVEGMTAGRGWIALALVIFATWRPFRLVLGALLFGGITILELHSQALGLGVPAQFLAMLPYLGTILVVVLISGRSSRLRLRPPADLGNVFHPPR